VTTLTGVAPRTSLEVEISARIRRQALAVTAIGATGVAATAIADPRLSLVTAAVVLGWTRLVGL
jgi:hypothetical protein